ncbi:hypothetical protein SAMN05421736_11031 [Evansella caseinilytica]|uniref:DUF8042 domain-containing protein n=1 Tax=Evansella caseinilytica TaxID=1503961 RepID=A0A1H3S6L3_9BACI|nr:hypothetical protein [Evansella caseinilytica]SDZ33544.1 hypothetical protein SAMN05421736_11031 [Evansella caseinilytica]
MEKYIDVMKQSIELSETVLEGVIHIKKLLGEGKFEETMYLFEDVILAFSTVELSITPIKEKLTNNEIDATAMKVKEALALAVSGYETRSRGRVLEVIQFTLVLQVKKWKEELEKAFQLYTVS